MLATTESESRLRWNRAFLILAWSVILLQSAILIGDVWLFSTDDAYITLRYSTHLADGHGIVWNIGEVKPVEGYSSFLFVVVGALSIIVGWDPLVVFKLIGVAALSISCLTIYKLARLRTQPALAVLAPLLFTAYPGTTFWAVSGLETLLYVLLVLAAIEAFLHGLGFRVVDEQGCALRAPWSATQLGVAGFLVFLASLTRPEGPIVGIAIGTALLFEIGCSVRGASGANRVLPTGLRQVAVLTLSFSVPFSIYFAGRYGYFERVWPNPVYCKQGYSEDAALLIRNFFDLAYPYLLFALMGARRWTSAKEIALVVLIVGYAIALYGKDPIIGHFNRHFLASYAAVLILACHGFHDLFARMLRRMQPGIREMATLTTAFALALVVFAVTLSPGDRDRMRNLAIEYAFRQEGRHRMGLWLAARLSPSESYVLGDVGIATLASSDVNVIDAYCLNNREMTLPPISKSNAELARRLLEQNPRVIVLPSKPGAELQPKGRVHEHIVKSPVFQRRYAEVKRFRAGQEFEYWVFERM